MGHIRVGRLPKTVTWLRVSELLAESPEAIPLVAAATVEAAERQLRQLAENNALNYSFWLLTRIATAARVRNFVGDLGALGLNVQPDMTTLGFIVQLADHVREQNARFGLTSHVDDLATLALRGALTETVGAQGQSLFGSSVQDVQQAFRQYATDVQFGVVAHRFFGNFFGRTLRFVIERDLPNQVGGDKALGNVADAAEFSQSLDLYARQSAQIMRQFAVGWYGKNNWATKRAITQQQSRQFVRYAIRKLRTELKFGPSGG
jgi:hypothetical protein